MTQKTDLRDEEIAIRGAKVHNLKNISVTLPRNKLVVLTGVSGSGKSSLAFDTIYAEGQRRYVESLSAYARQFLEQLSKPDIESITGLSPTISIEQRTTSYNPRSTVGTVTEIYDYLRLLFARVSKPYCWKCEQPIRSQSPQQVVDSILSSPLGTRLSILAPIVRGRKGEYQKELLQLRQRGFVRVRVDGDIHDLSDDITLDKNKKHDISVYIDRLIIKGDLGTLAARISDSVELGLKLGEGMLILETQPSGATAESEPIETLLSEKFACPTCHISYPSPEPRTFSFNSPMGACPECDGLGTKPSPEDLDAEEDTVDSDLNLDAITGENAPCSSCNGARLRKESLHYRLAERNISNLTLLSISELSAFFNALVLTDREQLIANRILKEIKDRCGFLNEVGVGYLSLSRSAQSLSGGESQRIRLATQIGSSLVGVIYVLDEPSIGLHQKDNRKLLNTLKRLRDMGNSVLVVEHDRETIEEADWIVDLGPGAGSQGGELVAEGSLKQLLRSKKSITAKYLNGELEIATPKTRRTWTKANAIRLEKATQNNLKNITIDFPLGVFTCVTGTSGSGKSTLVIDTLYRLLAGHVYRMKTGEIKIAGSRGLELVDKVIDIDQRPIGKTPRSNPATYTGLFSLIRELFASLPDSKVRGYGPGRYSFNVKGGRCEACEGDGVTKVEMHFLPDVFVECDICKGRRYNRDTLEIRYKGKNIADVLDMTGSDAYAFFDAIPSIKAKLKVLNEVGLGYLHLGQSATTLSGGEAQRIKLSKELSRRGTGKTVYILDEPTTGLHFDDVNKLVAILQTLVSQGNTVIVIEHNLDLIKVADYVIDMGPEGGAAGGYVIAKGTPEELALIPESDTGRYLKTVL
ncbi:MAG: ABC-ATPase UvrA [Bdellovibrionales bacterium GWB1_52_6]|nr:MAG: ABC-ATPase UvrA [Bdellovibrionales bacterium GWB1_52_6]OFZ04436.1 MAG: ABC-ATPase UvrA [Bdellovibrionales bacterium GWA1_52_35]HCM40705.1 excinuclease ABC subunit A [Bdellovibrionales bacterium]